MKKILLTIISLCLIVASIFGLYSGVLGVKDVLGNLQTYKQAEADSGLRQIEEELLPGIDQLTENLNVYLDGVQQVADGRAQLADGYAQYAAGQAELAAGAQQLREGEAALADGQKQIDDNTQAYNEGKEKIAMLEGYMPLIEGIASSMQAVRDFNAGLPVVGETIDSVGGQLRASVMNLLANSGAVAAISDMVGMDIGSLLASNPEDTSICANVVAMYYDGLAQLKQYEDGLVALEEGKKQLAEGYAAYAAGEAQLAAGAQQLADGEAQLADGLAQLSVFEQGEITLAVGLTRLLTQPSYENNGVGQVFYDGDLFFKDMADQIFTTLLDNIQDENARATAAAAIYPGFYGTEDTSMWNFPTREGNGTKVCDSVLDLVREKIPGFNPVTDLFAKNDDGSVRVENGYPLVNLDVARTIAQAGQDYINIAQTNSLTSEAMGKAIGYVILMVGCLLGLIAGLLGLIRKGAFAGFGIVACLLGIAAVVFTWIKGGFKGYAFAIANKPFEIDADGYATTAWPWGHNIRDGANAITGNQLITGQQQLKAIVIFAIVALLFALIALIAKKAIKAEKAKKYTYKPTPAPAAAAPVAQPVAQPVYAAPVVETPVVEKKVVVTEPVVEKVVVTEPVVEKVVKTPAEIAAEAATKAAAAQAAADAAAAEAAAAQAAADAAAAAALD